MVPAVVITPGWNTTFPQPSFLDLKVWVEIWAASEIRAAMGNEEGGIDFLFRNQLGQRLKIAFYVGLAGAQAATFLHDRALLDLSSKMPGRMRCRTPFPPFRCNDRPEMIDPTADCFVRIAIPRCASKSSTSRKLSVNLR
jgi:hypothetical protein